MIKAKYLIPSGLLLLFIIGASPTLAEDPKGTLKAGYVFTDEVGNNGVYQPSYNLYEGFGLSLEDFSYKLENDIRFFGDFKNITLNNRRFIAGASKTGLFNLRLSHNQYRRSYSFDGDKSTRRLNSNGSFWVQAHKNIKVFGGYGQISRKGESIELTEFVGFPGVNKIDYSQKYFSSGARFSLARSFLEFDFRGSNFTNELDATDERNAARYRISASAPIPKLNNFYVNGGFQQFNLEFPNISDTLTAQTGWGGVRYFNGAGVHVKYSFIWDRARRTTDLVATDNITNAVYVGKEWHDQGGLTIGFRRKINDDFSNELSTNGYFFSSWLKPHQKVTLKAGYGSELTEVESGTTLTGDKDFTRYHTSVAYKFKQGNWRVKFESKKTENKDIGSTAEFTRLGTDASVNADKYGELQASYDYLKGDYENVGGKFKFIDHVVWGNVLSQRYHNFQAGVGGTYVRSREDLDVENFSLKFTGNYIFGKVNKVEVIYSAYNFDDFKDPAPIYSRYYTANIVEIYLSREF